MMERWRSLLKRHRAVLFSLAVVLAVAGLLTLSTVKNGGAVLTAAEVTNWGLSFQEEGKPPVGNATAEYLQQYDSLYCVPTEEKVLYLTFDAGFEKWQYRENSRCTKKASGESHVFSGWQLF